MSDVQDKADIDELIGVSNQPPAPDHDEWFRSKVRETLAKKAKGEVSYTPLDFVRKEFGF